jgi:hypothetical protein
VRKGSIFRAKVCNLGIKQSSCEEYHFDAAIRVGHMLRRLLFNDRGKLRGASRERVNADYEFTVASFMC